MSGTVQPGGGGADRIRFIGLFIWGIASLFFLYEFFLRTFFGTLEPEIVKALQLNATTFSILGSAYYLTYGIMQVPVGVIVDRFGVKITAIIATVLCGLSALLLAGATNFGVGLAARLLMGFGSSFAFLILLVVARDWFPRKNFGLFAGLSQFIGTLGPILAGGPLVAVLQDGDVGWRTAISSLGFFGFVLTILCALFLRGRKAKQNGEIRFLLPKLSVGQQVGMLLKTRQAWYVAIYSALIYTSIATLGAIWGTRVLIAKGLPHDQASDMDSVLWIGYAVGCPIAGYISDTMKRRQVVLIAMAVLAFLATTALWAVPSGTLLVFGTIFFVIGLAGGAQNVGFAAIVEKVSDRLSATSMGLNNGLMLLFDTVNPILFGLLVTITMTDGGTDFTASNFNYALAYIPILCLIALAISIFLIRETYCKPELEPTLLDPNTPPHRPE
jgi:MFS family permease